MEQAGAFFGADTEDGDTVLLHGDLGTGKTCFARGFIRARVGNPCLAVTSPSYLLDNTYKVEDEDVTSWLVLEKSPEEHHVRQIEQPSGLGQ
eukprot:g15696.t2